MKKFLTLWLAVAAAAGAHAEGYQANTLSAKQLGMGHVGTAMKLDAEALHFNPAAAAFQQSDFNLSLGITGIQSNATFTPLNDYSGTAAAVTETDNKISTPLYFYFNCKPTRNLALGLSFTTPYGSTMKWNDHWSGAHLIQDINLAAYSIQPTVSYKFWDKLSVGAGLMISWGNFDLARSMFPVGAATNNFIAQMLSANPATQPYAPLFQQAGDNALVSAKLKGDAKVAVGINLGLMWDINEAWTLGFSFRSKLNMKAEKGTASLNYLNAQIQQVLAATGYIPALDQGTFSAELPLPANWNWGVSFRPTERWEFAVDLQYVRWSAYESLNVSFNEKALKIEDIYSVKNYDNTLIFRFGGQFRANKYLTARMGMYLDESPVRSDYLNPETPSMTKVSYTAGLSIRPARCMSIDLAYGYLTSADPERTGSYPYVNPLKKALYLQQGMDAEAASAKAMETFSGNYALYAHSFSLGMSFNF